MSILNYFDYLAVIIKISAKKIVFQEILKNCLPLNLVNEPHSDWLFFLLQWLFFLLQ